MTTVGASALAARRGWVGYAEKPAGKCDIAGPIGIGEEAVVPDAVEPVGQHVDHGRASAGIFSRKSSGLVTWPVVWIATRV